MRRNLFVLFLVAAFLLPSAALSQTAVRITAQEKKIAEAITADQLKDYLYFVASDEMEGRDTPSRGLDITAKFIATLLDRWGVKPAGDDGTYFQKIALSREIVDPAGTSIDIGGQKFLYGEDIVRVSGNATGPVAGPVVFAGNGWMITSKGLNPYKDLDVRGKFIAVLGEGQPSNRYIVPLPAGMTSEDVPQAERGKGWADAVTYGRANGALGVILLPSKFIAENWRLVTQMFSRSRLVVDKLHTAVASPMSNVFVGSPKLANALFAGESANPLSGAADPFALSPVKVVNPNLAMKKEVQWTQNVVGLWEGRDPVLKNEMVAIGAHYDHDGVRPNAPGPDKIWNGADDDGSGTVAVLAIAETLAKSKKRPKRSVLFVWHAGEEKGLWGSEYFNKFPTVDIRNVVAQLNIDMIGRSKKPGDTNPKNKELTAENEIYVIGSEMMSTTLGTVVKGSNAGYLDLTYNYRYDNPKDPNRFFFRSDHFNYAVNGIPIAFWFDGVHEDYHQASDHADKIDYVKMEKVTRTIFLTLWELADLRVRPKVDKQLPAELMRR